MTLLNVPSEYNDRRRHFCFRSKGRHQSQHTRQTAHNNRVTADDNKRSMWIGPIRRHTHTPHTHTHVQGRLRRDLGQETVC